MSPVKRRVTKAKPAPAKPEHIKVRLPGEGIWAIKVTDTTATLDNMPLADGYAYGDLVEYEPGTMRVVRLIEHRYKSGVVRYDVPPRATDKDLSKIYRGIVTKLEKKGILCEGWGAGIIGIGYPTTMSADTLVNHVKDAGGSLQVAGA